MDYTSPDGSQVLAVKAFAFSHRRAFLSETGHYHDYAQQLGSVHQGVFTAALASSWIPVETVIAHYAALDAIGASETVLTRSTEALASSVYQTFFAALLRIIRGRDGALYGLTQADRVVSRIYRGGAVAVTLVGEREALYELKGVPFANARSFRLAHCTFIRSAINMTNKACTVREIAGSCPRTENYAVVVSWT